MEGKLYFAYGSNIDRNQMKHRCLDSKFLRVVYLEDYEFVYDGYSHTWNRATANIIPKKGSIVWGVLYEISEDDEKRLDRYEGFPKVYQKGEVIVKYKDGDEEMAFTYLRESKERGKPSKEYENKIVNAAKELNFPEEYINKYLKTSD